jgi:hypothetical protein
METRVMCLGKYKEFETTNANKRRLIGYFYDVFIAFRWPFCVLF